MSHALITGGAGAIGLHLARRLVDEGWRVDLLDNFQRGRRDTELNAFVAHDRVKLLDADLTDPRCPENAERGYSHIFHLAALLGVQIVIDRPRAVLETNVLLTINALEVARRQKALDRFVFASTSEVYAGTLKNFDLPIPTPESAPLALPDLACPRTSYMLSKIYGEALSQHSELPVTIVRPHNVYGPRMGTAHAIPQLLERAHRSRDTEEFEVYSIDHTRTFCYVDDAIEMIYRLALAPGSVGRAVNVGTESPEIRIGDLARIVARATDKALTIVARPPTQGSPRRRAPDMTLCATLTGYRGKVELEDGVARTYDWYRRNIFDCS